MALLPVSCDCRREGGGGGGRRKVGVGREVKSGIIISDGCKLFTFVDFALEL